MDNGVSEIQFWNISKCTAFPVHHQINKHSFYFLQQKKICLWKENVKNVNEL